MRSITILALFLAFVLALSTVAYAGESSDDWTNPENDRLDDDWTNPANDRVKPVAPTGPYRPEDVQAKREKEREAIKSESGSSNAILIFVILLVLGGTVGLVIFLSTRKPKGAYYGGYQDEYEDDDYDDRRPSRGRYGTSARRGGTARRPARGGGGRTGRSRLSVGKRSQPGRSRYRR